MTIMRVHTQGRAASRPAIELTESEREQVKSCRSGSNSGSERTEAACELTCPGGGNKSEYGQVNQVRRGSCGVSQLI